MNRETAAPGIYGELILPALTLWQREIVRFLRQKNRIIGALGTPIVFWILIGSGMGRSFRLPEAGGAAVAGAETSYIAYFFPGTLLLIMLFTAIFSTISIIEDRREGFLQGVLVAPVSRLAIVLGKLLGGTTLAVGQSLLFLALGPLVGVTCAWSRLAPLIGVLFLIGLGLTALGYLIAWPLDSTQGFHAIMNLFLMPLWLLSGALFPAAGASGWMRTIIHFNPLHYALVTLQDLLAPTVALAFTFYRALGIVIFFTLVAIGLSVWMTRRVAGKNP